MSYWLDDLFHGMPVFVEALCAQTDPEAFFPPKGQLSLGAQPKQLCRSCADLIVCREWAVATEEPFGVWGGTTARERRKLARRRDAA